MGLRHSPEASNVHLAVSNFASRESYTEITRRDVQFTLHNAVTSA